jgi:hypothetical protein
MRIAVALILLGSCCLGFAEDAPRVMHVEAMDRWIDLTWTDQGKSDNGFAVAVSRNGQDFEIAERVGPEARSVSVFVEKRPFSLFGWGGNLYLRVAALDAAGKPGAWSEVVSVKPAKPRDMLAVGLLYKEIAEKLNCSVYTVNAHVRKMYEKLQVHSRSQAVAKFRAR